MLNINTPTCRRDFTVIAPTGIINVFNAREWRGARAAADTAVQVYGMPWVEVIADYNPGAIRNRTVYAATRDDHRLDA